MPNDLIATETRVKNIEPNDLINLIGDMLDEKLRAFKKQEMDEKLVSPAEVCKMFQPAISKPTLQSWTQQGLLKDYRIGGRIFYRSSEIFESAKHLKRYKKQSGNDEIE